MLPLYLFCFPMVAPLVGAWIEMSAPSGIFINPSLSLPSWERGLKFIVLFPLSVFHCVAPLVGAWIEIPNSFLRNTDNMVAPLVGAWIEIVSGACIQPLSMSLPSWERGLKYAVHCYCIVTAGRSPRGSVD